MSAKLSTTVFVKIIKSVVDKIFSIKVAFFIFFKYMLDNNKLKNLGLKYINNSFYMLSKSRKLFKENGWYIFVEHPGNEYIIKTKPGTKKLQIVRKLGDKKFPPVTINDENCYNNETIKKIINILNERKYFNY